MNRKPDFILRALNKKTDERSGKLGCAWLNANGSLSLVLDMMVTITANSDVLLTLFPNEYLKKSPSDAAKMATVDPELTLPPSAYENEASPKTVKIAKIKNQTSKKNTMANLPTSFFRGLPQASKK